MVLPTQEALAPNIEKNCLYAFPNDPIPKGFRKIKGLKAVRPKSQEQYLVCSRSEPPARGRDADRKDDILKQLKESETQCEEMARQLGLQGHHEEVEEGNLIISQLHEYNEVKDVVQALLGKQAIIQGVTVKNLYADYGLDMED